MLELLCSGPLHSQLRQEALALQLAAHSSQELLLLIVSGFTGFENTLLYIGHAE